MQASFTPQEQQLIESLREKYSGLKDSKATSADEGDGSCMACSVSSRQIEPTSTSNNVEASICTHCHGTGTLVEIYNHRRLENFCKDCDGRGVRVFKNGKEVLPGAAASGGGAAGAFTSSAAAAPAGVVALHSGRTAGDAGTGSPDSEDPDERATALRREMQQIAARAASYTKERLDALALLQKPHSGTADQAGRDQAVRDLVAQLDLQLERLELVRLKKQATLCRLTDAARDRGGATAAAANVTLDDIIANEGTRA